MEIIEILTRESENTQQAYLYEERGRWYELIIDCSN